MSGRDATVEGRVEQILEAALQGFGSKGYHDMTMDDVVAASGLSKWTLYWYFTSKQDLFITLFRHTMQQLADGWAEVVADASLSAPDKIRRSVDFFRSRVEPMTSIFSVMHEAWVLTRRDAEIGRAAQDAVLPLVDLLTQIIEQGMEEGAFSVNSPKDAAIVILMLARGLVQPMGAAIDERNWDDITAAAQELVLHGLGVALEAYRD